MYTFVWEWLIYIMTRGSKTSGNSRTQTSANSKAEGNSLETYSMLVFANDSLIRNCTLQTHTTSFYYIHSSNNRGKMLIHQRLCLPADTLILFKAERVVPAICLCVIRSLAVRMGEWGRKIFFTWLMCCRTPVRCWPWVSQSEADVLMFPVSIHWPHLWLCSLGST